MGLCLRAESWIWYSCVMVVAIARFVSRTLLFRGDVKRLQVDDWLMFAALCFYTTLVVTINMVADSETNLFPPGYDFRSLTPSQISSRVFGSKLVLAVEQCQCATVWAVKACLLIMYYRLTIALRENFVVKILAAYVAFGFIFMEIFYFGVWCRPFHNYWAVPTPNLQCNAATDHLITNAVFNISSDLFLLVLALQMVVRSQLPLHRKLVLSIIFGLGIFVVLASILNKYYSFTNPYGQAWTFWYTRESSTSLLVANLPYTWTLLRRLFNLRAFDLQTSQHTATSLPSPQAPAFSYHSNRTKRARTRGKIRPSLTGTTVADPPPSASLSPKSTSKPGFKTARSDSHFSPSIPALPFLPPGAELPPSNTLHFPRPEMFRADTAPPACLESGLLDLSGTSIRSKSPGNRAHAHCRSDNDLLRPWHAGDTYLYASTSSSASNSGEDDDIEYDNGGVCALDPLSHHGRHHGRGHELCPCPPIDGLSLGLGADGWGEGDAWHGQLHLQQRQLARQHERMRRRSTRGARSRSRAESVLALKTRLGLPVELQEVPGARRGARRGAGGETGEESGGPAANMNDGARKQSAESLDARGRSRNRSRSRQRKNRDRTAPLPLPLPPPPPHLGSSTRPAPLGTMPPAPSPDTKSAPISTQLPPPPSPVLGLSRAPPLAAKSQAQASTHIDKINVDAYDQKMPTDSSLAAASASNSSSTTARALATAHFEAAKRRAASRGCHGGAVDELLELEREILMSDGDEKEEEGPGEDGCGSARRKGGSATTASAESAARAPVEAAVAAKVDNSKSTAALAQQPFTAPALVIGGAVDDGVNSQKAKQQGKVTAAADATPGSPSPSASLTAYHYTCSDVYTPSSLATDDDVVYHDARSRVVSLEAVSDEDGAREEDLEEGEGEEVDMEALDAGETTPLTDDPPSRSLELCRAGGGNGWTGIGRGGGGGGSDDYAEKEREQEKKKERKGGWAWRRKTKSNTQMKMKARKTRDKERDVWREVVGAGVEKKKRRLRMGMGRGEGA